jgi:hypothetical protein
VSASTTTTKKNWRDRKVCAFALRRTRTSLLGAGIDDVDDPRRR